MIEFDVTLTCDGVPVILHDRDLNRTTNGHGRLRKRSLDEIRKLDAGSWFSPKFAGERVPTLSEVLDRFGGKIQMHIEIKRDAVRLWPGRGVETLVLEEVRKRKLEPEVALSSFSERAVRRVKKMVPEIEAAILYRDYPGGDPKKVLKRTGADALHLSIRNLSEETVQQIKRAGMVLRVYTVDEEEDIRRMANWGVDGIFTNQVARALTLIRA